MNLKDAPWLEGFWAEGPSVGAGILEEIVERHGLLAEWRPDSGLLPSFEALEGQAFDPDRVEAQVHAFYEKTAKHSFSVSPTWYSPLFWFAAILIRTTCRLIDQFNLPLTEAEAGAAMGHDVVRLFNRQGKPVSTCWLRRSGDGEHVVYAGFYGISHTPDHDEPLVKVVFPVPDGYLCVLLKPTVHPDGGLELVSSGNGFGDAGFYWVQRTNQDSAVRVKYVPIEESIRVYVDAENRLQTDHLFYLWGIKFLALHYDMECRGALQTSSRRRFRSITAAVTRAS
ncbi:MAG: hypothetical protein ACNA8W_05720 [Bradymonadaceae bacterium]